MYRRWQSSSIRVKLGQRLRLVFQLPPRGGREALEWLEPHPPAIVSPRPRDCAIDQEGRHGLWSPGTEDEGTVGLRKYLRSARMRKQSRIPGRQETNRCRRVRRGQRRIGQIEELAAFLIAVAGKSQPLHRWKNPGDPEACPIRHIVQGRGTEAPEVAAYEALQAAGLRCVASAEPIVSEAVEIGPSLLPGPRGGNPHHFEPEAHPRPHNRRKPPGAEQVLEIVRAAWSARKLLTQ